MTYLLNMYLQNFRVQSPLFLITYPENNVFGVTNGTGIPQKAIAEGYWVLLDGLKAGEHTIEFTGGVSAFDFETHVTYHITIEPKHNNNNNNNNNYYDNNEYKSYSNEYDKNYNNNYYDDNRNDSLDDKKDEESDNDNKYNDRYGYEYTDNNGKYGNEYASYEEE